MNTSDGPELASLATALDELTDRLAAMAEAAADEVATDLFEVERSLRNASRRLSKVVDALR